MLRAHCLDRESGADRTVHSAAHADHQASTLEVSRELLPQHIANSRYYFGGVDLQRGKRGIHCEDGPGERLNLEPAH